MKLKNIRMFKRKKAIGVFAIIGIIALIGMILGTGAGVTYWLTKPEPKEWDGIEVPENPDPVEKVCNIEGGCNGYDIGDKIGNSATSFMITCQDLKKNWGTDIYFIVGTECKSCKDYWGGGGRFGNTISFTVFPTKQSCQENIFNSNPACLDIKSEKDCGNAKLLQPICSVIDYEKYCSSISDQLGECPEIKIAGIVPFPDLWCKLKNWLDDLFFPIRILLSILTGFFGMLLLITILKSDEIDFEYEKAIIPLGIAVGILIGLLMWYIWYFGLVLFGAIIIFKLFVIKWE